MKQKNPLREWSDQLDDEKNFKTPKKDSIKTASNKTFRQRLFEYLYINFLQLGRIYLFSNIYKRIKDSRGYHVNLSNSTITDYISPYLDFQIKFIVPKIQYIFQVTHHF